MLIDDGLRSRAPGLGLFNAARTRHLAGASRAVLRYGLAARPPSLAGAVR